MALLTADELGQKLKLHPRTIMAMARRREIPGSKIGKQWFFREDEVFEAGRPRVKARTLVQLSPQDRARIHAQRERVKDLLGHMS